MRKDEVLRKKKKRQKALCLFIAEIIAGIIILILLIAIVRQATLISKKIAALEVSKTNISTLDDASSDKNLDRETDNTSDDDSGDISGTVSSVGSTDTFNASTNTINFYDDGKWNLMLVNASNTLDESYAESITLTQLRNGQSVDSRCYPYLQEMMDDCRAAGYSPIICSSYRTYQRQQEIFNEQVQTYINQGMTRKEAKAKTADSVALPGTSEHELGLAVDITDVSEQKIVSGMDEQPVQKWLMKNCYKYGFILRYPKDKEDVTGIVYEPWHFRYVGKEAAKYIYENDITLEEYVG